MSSAIHPSIMDVPEVHDKQFHGAKNGTIKQNVNLFRGNTNFIFPFATFTGRNGLSVKIGGQYQSAVQYTASRSNLKAPTSTLGLGWNIHTDKIIAQYEETALIGSITYSYVSNGGSNRLYLTDRKWQRGKLLNQFVNTLNQAVFSPTLLKAILAQSIRIDSTTKIEIMEQGKSWILSDALNEFSLQLTLINNQIIIYDGGELYEGDSFNFSRIRYYRQYEKWAVTDKLGITKVFGGLVMQDANGIKTSKSNSIEWAVRWGNWKGPSILTHDSNGGRVQQQYPTTWNHRITRSSWEDQIRYDYTQETQNVGKKGLPYTKANYLAKVTGVFGRTATFNYADKQFDNSKADAPREYLDPNKAIPSNTPDAYQSRYETKYLSSIDIASKANKLIYSWQLAYNLEQYASISGNTPPNFLGDSIKRVLTKIAKVMPDGSSFPSETYSYYKAGTTNAGGLQTRTYKAGASTTYFYTKGSLITSERSLQINSPNGIEKPRVWFGEDYAVVLWQNQSNLYISVYTWVGRWIAWSPKIAPISVHLNLDSLNVMTQGDSFIISGIAQNNQLFYLLPYYKDNTILGGWIDDPQNPLQLPVSNNDIEVTAGKDFFVVNDTATNEVTRFTWSRQQKAWIKDVLFSASSSSGQNRYFLTATNNMLVSLDYDIAASSGSKNNELTLFYLDEFENWQKGDSIKAPAINIEGQTNTDLQNNFHWTTAPWAFIASVVNNETSASLAYSLYIYTWSNQGNKAYTFEPVVVKNYTQKLTSSGKRVVPYIAELSSNGLLVSGPNLLRFNGQEWLENDNLKIQTTIDDQNVYWFSHGPDIVLKTENTPNQIISAAQVFDPNTQKTSWQSDSISICKNPPTSPRLSQYHPTGGKDFVSFNRNLYYRGTTTNWETGLSTPLSTTLPPDVNVVSLINAAPNFFAYKTVQNGTTIGTQIVRLQNGVAANGTTLPDNFFTKIDDKGNVVASTNGKSPIGANAFVTYQPLTKPFDEASSLTLHRFLNDDLSEELTGFAVYKVEVNDGFSTVTTNYDFNFVNAAVGPYGKTIKFFDVKVYQGNTNAKAYGWTEYQYNNGIGLHPSVGNPTIPAGFDGLPKSVAVFNAAGQQLKSTEYQWTLYKSILENPTAPTQTSIRGSYVLAKNITKILDGVSITKNFTYDFASGEEIQQSSDRYNADGQQEKLIVEKTLGFHQFENLWFNNVLKTIIQTKSLNQLANTTPTVAAVKATTWKAFSGTTDNDCNSLSVYAPYEKYQWIGETASSDFDFSAWQQGTEPIFDYGTFKGWLRKSVINQRNQFGSPVIFQDAKGDNHSIQYDLLGQFKIADFFAADSIKEEASYYGFEPYEVAENWTIKSPAAIVDTNAYTGTRSLCLLNKGTLSNTFAPTSFQKIYVLGWWYATDANYKVNKNSGWQIEVTQNGQVIQQLTQSIPFDSTNGQWKFAYTTIKMNALPTNAAVKINATAINTSAIGVFIDNIRFLPEVSHFSAQVYQPDNQLLTETIGLGTEVTRTVYNSLLQHIGKVGPYGEQTTSFEQIFFARQAALNVTTSSPNHHCIIKPLNGGYMEAFKGGESWKKNWAISNFSANWKLGNGYLTHNIDTQNDTITTTDTELKSDFGLYLEMTAPNATAPVTLKNNFTISLNANTTFVWNGSQWIATINGQTQALLQANQETPTNVLLVFTPKAILFFANGQLIVSTDLAQPIVGTTLKIATGKNKIAFRNLAILKQPSTQIKFYDGAEKLRQEHTLIGDNATLGALIYDEVGEKIVVTKNAPARFSSIGDNTPLFVYNKDFVKVAAFLNNLATTGEMTGNLATYYNGSNNPSNDENYPYQRNLLEASPLARVIESGQPGKGYAIVNPSSTPAKSRPTVKYVYSSNTTSINNLPTGNYFIQSTIDQMGNESAIILDKTQQILFKSKGSITKKTAVVYQPTGRILKQFLPNYFNKQLSGNQQFIESYNYNLLGQVVETNRPDQGTVKIIYDLGGHKRFVQDAEGADKGYFAYYKYDDLNRIVEQGIYHETWDAVTLRQKANDINWPSKDPKQTIHKQVDYVLHGASVNGIGKINSTVNFNPSTKRVVKENYEYNQAGQIIGKTLTISEGNKTIQSTTIQYERTFTGQIAQINYPQDLIKGMLPLCYTYDQLNRLIGIGVVNQPFRHAFYAYNSAGQLITESTNNQTIKNQFTYYSPGWLKSMDNLAGTSIFKESIQQRFANGKVKNILDTFDTQTTKDTLQYNIDFDALDRLAHAQYTNPTDWTMAIQEYDQNGNVLKMTQGTDNLNYAYLQGTNQLMSIKKNNDFEFQGTYNKNGALATLNNKNQALIFSYVNGQRLTDTVFSKKTGETLSFSYTQGGKRSSKIISKDNKTISNKTYIHGTHPLPLLELEDGKPTAYIYGASGLVAFYQNDTFYYVSKDHLGSNRLVQDEKGNTIAAYNFETYGKVKTVGGTNPNILSYLYTGQEYDAEIGLYNYRARLYDPIAGRFVTTDPKNQTASPYTYVNNDPFNLTDPTGESFFGNFFSWIGQAIVDVVEIVAAVAIDAVTFGAATPFTGGLLGAGINGAVYDVGALVTQKKPSWKGFGEAQAIGAVTGAATAGVGELGAAAEEGIQGVAEGAETSAGRVAGKVAAKAANIGIQSAGGAVTGVTGKLIQNGIEGKAAGHGLGLAALTGGISGGIRTGVNLAGAGIIGPRPNLNQVIKKLVATGFIAGAANYLITTAIKKKRVNGLDLILATDARAGKNLNQLGTARRKMIAAPIADNPDDLSEEEEYFADSEEFGFAEGLEL